MTGRVRRGAEVSGRSRRVLFLSWRDEQHPLAGGSERTLGEVCRRLAADGHDVTVHTARYSGSRQRESLDGVSYVRRGGRLSVYLAGFLRAADPRYDAVFDIQNGIPFFSSLVAWGRSVLVVHHVHREQWPVATGPLTARVGWFVESRVAPLLYRRRPIVAMSRSTRDELVELGYAFEHIDVVHNGCTTPPPVPGPATTPTLVVVSRLVPHKQVDHAIHLLAMLRSQREDVDLVVVGEGYDHERLVAIARSDAVAQHVRFTGHVSEDEKYRILSSGWIHVFPSLKEGWGLVAVEAASVGVPTIAYRSAGGVVESVQDGETGFLVDDLKDMYRAALMLLEDQDLRARMREHCLSHADRTTWATTVEGFWRAAAPVLAQRTRR